MSKDPKSVLRRFVDEVLNRKKLEAMEEFVAEGFVEHVPFPGQGPGRQGLRDALEMFFEGFPDLLWTTEEQVAEGEKVVSRFTWTGTHKGAFLGIAPTGRQVKVWGIVMDVVREGWFVESRILMDIPGLVAQLKAGENG